MTNAIDGPPLGEAACRGLEAAAARAGVELLIVFGSFSRGEAGAESDLDLGVLFGPRGVPSLSEQLALADELQRFVEREVDLVVLDDAPPLLRHEAARGEPLYQGRIGAFSDFAARALFDLEDVRPYLRRTARSALRGAPA